MANLTPTQNQHCLQGQSLLWEAYAIILMASNANEKTINIIDIQAALRGALVLMEQGLDHLGEL
ncbi:hypothetical protein [Gallibacterium genomosp. 3]|uniref:Uncharacterized protein n=1 Tax=Gallibacterium genomosp. 3 TaxID=505345 RepID=A0A1A7PX02_9PAST|nr:hypothetical protein [Gallibacterium genomosp. 3]OBX07118.1 hypothetical protein QV07_07495 [Gallibacterium genomosp. 3]